MDVKIDINPDEINRAVTESIVKSMIGSQMQTAIRELLSSYKLQTIIESIVHRAITEVIQQEVMTKHVDTIRAAVREKLTEEIVTTMVTNVWERVERDYR